MSGNPIHIIMTPTRNEAWVIKAFLECNGLWADYIIIADQMSVDGTREIIAEYNNKCKIQNRRCTVKMIDNKNPDFNESERQALLVAKAREIAAGRDTLLWGLDADEILPANWQETEDGKHIIHSIKGDVFWFKWANLSPDKIHYGDAIAQPWLFHDDGVEPHGNYVRNMHSMRIPYPIEEKHMYYVKDFRVLHCGFLNMDRTAAKSRFYKFVDWNLNKRNPISLGRQYSSPRREKKQDNLAYVLNQESVAFPFDFWALIDTEAPQTWFDDYVAERLNLHPVNEIRKIDIWDKEFLKNYSLVDPRGRVDKWVHAYLHKTQKIRKKFIIRVIDKILKWLY